MTTTGMGDILRLVRLIVRIEVRFEMKRGVKAKVDFAVFMIEAMPWSKKSLSRSDLYCM